MKDLKITISHDGGLVYQSYDLDGAHAAVLLDSLSYFGRTKMLSQFTDAELDKASDIVDDLKSACQIALGEVEDEDL